MVIKSQAAKATTTLNGHNGHGALRSVLEIAFEESGFSRSDLTVLSPQVDPYRLDTPSGHRDGKWAAQQLAKGFGKNGRTHWRGLHYSIVARGNVKKPDGTTYQNNDADWNWLSANAGKAARWLGYIDFERIKDARNAEPIIHRKARVTPSSWVSVGIDVDIPAAEDLDPCPGVAGFVARQAFSFVIFGEKTSLEDVLLPVARAHDADLYLPSGEISDALLWRIAKDADDDGRPLVVIAAADCDPAGYQMSVSIARKLQALRDLLFPNLRFEVVPATLTVEQVRELGLPSTPLKETEKRADRWRTAFGVEQTEIDALATLQPAVLREIVTRAFDPYFDRTLKDRVDEAKAEWMEEAESALAEQTDDELLAELREEATAKLDELRSEIDRINDQLRIGLDDLELPPIEVPESEIDEDSERLALVSFDQDWVEQTRAMIERKSYGAEQ
jgi:hypothetical protein